MAKPKTDGAVTFNKGAIPMNAAGRKYKVRNPTPHDFTQNPDLTGRLVAKGTMQVDGEDRAFIVVESGTALSQVYESKAMEELFRQGEIGDFCEIVYEGTKDLGGGRQFKRFRVAVWSE